MRLYPLLLLTVGLVLCGCGKQETAKRAAPRPADLPPDDVIAQTLMGAWSYSHGGVSGLITLQPNGMFSNQINTGTSDAPKAGGWSLDNGVLIIGDSPFTLAGTEFATIMAITEKRLLVQAPNGQQLTLNRK